MIFPNNKTVFSSHQIAYFDFFVTLKLTQLSDMNEQIRTQFTTVLIDIGLS